ncbi:zf-TFIIB domain-containing protein [Chloroflexota bacterium]
MNCPVCKGDKGAMVIVEHEQIELDYCTNCDGVWFDYGELDLLLERLDLDGTTFSMNAILALPDKQVKEALRKCPICKAKMRKVVVGSEPEVLIDACPRGDGIWFDGGEVQQVIRQLVDTAPAGAGGEGKVISFLGEVFKASGH